MNNERTVLLVDEDESNRLKIATFLRPLNFVVHCAASGKQALSCLVTLSPDVVLTDLQLSDIDGLAILRASIELQTEIPVIVISCQGIVENVIEALRLGACDYLLKPVVNLEVLKHAVDRAIERKQLKAENIRYRLELEKANRELREHVRVLERDQKAGLAVQKKLLPPASESFNGVKISYRLIPSLYLSGDFIDFGFLSQRYIAFYLTDVSGHGAASAFVTVWLKQIVRRYLREANVFESDDMSDGGEILNLNLENLMASINYEVIHSKLGCHMTCFVGIIDTCEHTLEYVVAGHLPLPILVMENHVKYLENDTVKGKPLGIFSDATWHTTKLQLSKPYKLFVFSDGVLEVLPPKGLIEKEAFLLSTMGQESKNVDDVVNILGIDHASDLPDDIAILEIESEMIE